MLSSCRDTGTCATFGSQCLQLSCREIFKNRIELNWLFKYHVYEC